MTDSEIYAIVKQAFTEIPNDAPEAAFWAVKLALRASRTTTILPKTKNVRMMVCPHRPTEAPHEESPDCRAAGCTPFTNKN